MQVKISSLNAAQVRAVKTDVSANEGDLVAVVGKTYVVLNGSAAEARDGIQRVMDVVREAGGGRDTSYRSLVALRNKLDTAAKARGGKSQCVSVVPNGVDLAPATPTLLDGVASPGVAEEVPARRRGVPRQSTEKVAPPVAEVEAPAVKVPPVRIGPTLTADHRPNLEFMMRSAPSDAAKKFWRQKLEEIPA